jgi:hypothetical protein
VESEKYLSLFDIGPGLGAGLAHHRHIGGNKFKSRKKRWQAKFAKPQAEYAKFYREDIRTIKRWIATGKKHSDLPPLDDPPAMLGWFQDRHKRPASQCLYDLHAQSEAAANPKPLDLSAIKGLTPEQNVQRLREMLEITERNLRQAVEASDENKAAICRRDYNPMFEIWRKAEESLATIEKARGNSLDRATVETEIAQSLEMLRLSRQTMPGASSSI